jgi:hypothetical protein
MSDITEVALGILLIAFGGVVFMWQIPCPLRCDHSGGAVQNRSLILSLGSLPQVS